MIDKPIGDRIHDIYIYAAICNAQSVIYLVIFIYVGPAPPAPVRQVYALTDESECHVSWASKVATVINYRVSVLASTALEVARII